MERKWRKWSSWIGRSILVDEVDCFLSRFFGFHGAGATPAAFLC